jgi:hypothetical protein
VQKKKGMKRMRFFDGLFLTENEFNLEQQYLVEPTVFTTGHFTDGELFQDWK